MLYVSTSSSAFFLNIDFVNYLQIIRLNYYVNHLNLFSSVCKIVCAIVRLFVKGPKHTKKYNITIDVPSTYVKCPAVFASFEFLAAKKIVMQSA